MSKDVFVSQNQVVVAGNCQVVTVTSGRQLTGASAEAVQRQVAAALAAAGIRSGQPTVQIPGGPMVAGRIQAGRNVVITNGPMIIVNND